MAIVPNSARLLVLTARKSDLEYRITMMMNQTQRLAQENAEVLEEKYNAVQNYISSQMTTGEADVPPTINMVDAVGIEDFEVQLAQIANAQNRLDIEQKKLETNHKAVSAEEEKVQKLVDNSIKNEIGYFKD